MAEFPAAAFRLDGDPGAIRGSAASYAAFGAQTSDAAGQIRSLDTSLFIGPEGDQYRAGLKESLPPHLDVTGQAYSLVATALTTFAGALSGLQDRMAPLAVRAPGLWEDLQTAQGSLATAQTADRVHAQLRAAEAAAANPSHPLPPDTYVTQAGAASAALSSAQQAWNDCLTAAGQVKTDLHTAIDACCSTIRRASGMRFKRNPHGLGAVWSGVTHFVKDHLADLARLSHALKALAIHAGVFLYNGLADVVNGAASFGNAMAHHAGATITMLGGMALFTVSAGGEGLGIFLDATGVGSPLGVTLNAVSAAGMTAGIGLTGSAAVSLAHDAAGPDRVTPMHHKSTGGGGSGSRTVGEPPDGAKSGWEGRVADNGKGEVWQRPGAIRNADSIRVMDPTSQYPNGYVRFYNDQGQPVDLNGKPGPDSATHIPRNPDGSYPLPKGW